MRRCRRRLSSPAGGGYLTALNRGAVLRVEGAYGYPLLTDHGRARHKRDGHPRRFPGQAVERPKYFRGQRVVTPDGYSHVEPIVLREDLMPHEIAVVARSLLSKFGRRQKVRHITSANRRNRGRRKEPFERHLSLDDFRSNSASNSSQIVP